MATQPLMASVRSRELRLESLATFPRLRVLAWDRDVLYAARGYELLWSRPETREISWTRVAAYRPEWWRELTCRSPLTSRLVRDGFHALSVLPGGSLVAALPGAIATLRAGNSDWQFTHRIHRGTRPLHLTATLDGRVFWGEYFDNPERDEVYIYGSDDGGITWNIAHAFAKSSIRHVHNILYDKWRRCLWIFTGDYGRECRILRASTDFSVIDEVLAGSQQARAVAAIVTEGGLFFASDTPLEENYIYHLDCSGRAQRLQRIPSSSIYGCQNRSGMFFSTMVEPSEINRSRDATIFASADGSAWKQEAAWRKDGWPMKFFQYGNAFLPDGENTTDLLAATTIAVKSASMQTFIWRTTAV